MTQSTNGRAARHGAARKKLRFAASFLRRRLVHTNLQITYACNMKCQICDFWQDRFRAMPTMTLAQAEVVAEKLARIGPQVVSIGGGEPLLHPEIVPIVRAFDRFHFPVMICNGWHVTDELARDLFAAGMYEISISVDYADAARHDAQRGLAGSHARAVAALATLMRNRARPHQRVHMITVVMDDNLDEIEPLILLCREIGVSYLLTLYSDARGAKALRAVPPEVSARLLDLKARYPEFVALRTYIGRFADAVADGGVAPCHAGRNLLNVDSAGNVALCIDRLDDPVGNILTDDPLELEARLRAQYAANTCTGCWTSCRGCLEALMYGGRPLANLRDYRGMIRDVPLAARP